MVRGSATAVPRKILIPGLIFLITVSGETTADCQLPGDIFSMGSSLGW
jgi:hypothetical protein